MRSDSRGALAPGANLNGPQVLNIPVHRHEGHSQAPEGPLPSASEHHKRSSHEVLQCLELLPRIEPPGFAGRRAWSGTLHARTLHSGSLHGRTGGPVLRDPAVRLHQSLHDRMRRLCLQRRGKRDRPAQPGRWRPRQTVQLLSKPIARPARDGVIRRRSGRADGGRRGCAELERSPTVRSQTSWQHGGGRRLGNDLRPVATATHDHWLSRCGSVRARVVRACATHANAFVHSEEST